MNLSAIIEYKYGPGVNFDDEVILQDDGKGPHIAKWNLAAPKPSIADLETIAESQEFKGWYKERQSDLIDVSTAKNIRGQIHPNTPVDEQLGVLRYALTELYNRLGEALPDELIAFNDIANAAIQEGSQKKEALQ